MRIYSRLALVVIASGVVLALAVGAMAVPARLLDQAGSGDLGSDHPPPAGPAVLQHADGSMLAVLREEQNRQSVPLDTIPPHVIRRSWRSTLDSGSNMASTSGHAASVPANVEQEASAGGSTITQQLVKLDVLGNEQTLDRKVEEIVLASPRR